jgi:hypothetical protein
MADQPDERGGDELRSLDDITEPARLLRIIGLTRQVFEELRHDDQGLDEAARAQVQATRRTALADLRDMLPDASRDELDHLTGPLDAEHGPDGPPPSGTQLRLAEAQLLGWLEGLLKGLEAHKAFTQIGDEVQQAREMRQARSSPPSDKSGGSPGYF